MSKAFLTTKEAAHTLSISEDKLARLRRTGGGPPFTKMGREVRYNIRTLAQWAKAQEYTKVSEYSHG